MVEQLVEQLVEQFVEQLAEQMMDQEVEQSHGRVILRLFTGFSLYYKISRHFHTNIDI